MFTSFIPIEIGSLLARLSLPGKFLFSTIWMHMQKWAARMIYMLKSSFWQRILIPFPGGPFLIVHSFTMKVETVFTPKTLVPTYQTHSLTNSWS
jgi:hypothetical protein